MNRETRIIGFTNTLCTYYPQFTLYYSAMTTCKRYNCITNNTEGLDDDQTLLYLGTFTTPDYVQRVGMNGPLAWLVFGLTDTDTILRNSTRLPLPDPEIFAITTIILVVSGALNPRQVDCTRPLLPLAEIHTISRWALGVGAPKPLSSHHATHMFSAGIDVRRIDDLSTYWTYEWVSIMAVIFWSLRELARQLGSGIGICGSVESILVTLTAHKATERQHHITHAVLGAFVGYGSAGVYTDPLECIIELI